MFKKGEITKKRKEIKISQNELAARMCISRPTLNKIEKGARTVTESEQRMLQEIFQALSDDHSADNDYERVNIPQKNIEKFKQVMLYVLEKVGAKPNVGMTVLYKLFYFIDFDYYEKYEQQLMGLTYVKNTHGPTPREFKVVVDEMKSKKEIEEVKSTYFKFEQKKFLPCKEADLSLLNGRELEMIDDVLARYADKSAKELSDMTHRDGPWKSSKYGEDINYELAFYRPDEFSVRDYEEL